MCLQLFNIRALVIPLFIGLLWLITVPVQAACVGCLCPGDPCQLCPLPAMAGAPAGADEPEVCAQIKAIVPPISDLPGSNEYFYSLDKSMLACVKAGGDVIRNPRRNAEFTSRVYCKPPTVF